MTKGMKGVISHNNFKATTIHDFFPMAQQSCRGSGSGSGSDQKAAVGIDSGSHLEDHVHQGDDHHNMEMDINYNMDEMDVLPSGSMHAGIKTSSWNMYPMFLSNYPVCKVNDQVTWTVGSSGTF
eukprot:5099259-Ditylum_brightwellii.AAC.1